jgi:hypothetical protein
MAKSPVVWKTRKELEAIYPRREDVQKYIDSDGPARSRLMEAAGSRRGGKTSTAIDSLVDLTSRQHAQIVKLRAALAQLIGAIEHVGPVPPAMVRPALSAAAKALDETPL